MIHQSPKSPPVMANQLTDALSGHIVLAYNDPNRPGLHLIYEDGRLLHVFPIDGQIAVRFTRVREA